MHDLKKFLLLICIIWFSISLNGQTTWMPNNKLDTKLVTKEEEEEDDMGVDMGVTIVGVANGEIAVRTDEYFGILDAETLALKKDFKDSITAYPSRYINDEWTIFTEKRSRNRMACPPFCLFSKGIDDQQNMEKILACHPDIQDEKLQKMVEAEAEKYDSSTKTHHLIASQDKNWYVYAFTNYLDKTIDHHVYNNKLDLVYEWKIPYLQETKGININLIFGNLSVTNNGDIIYAIDQIAAADRLQMYVFRYHHQTKDFSNVAASRTNRKAFIKDKNAKDFFGKPENAPKVSSSLYKATDDQILYAGIYYDVNDQEKGIFIGGFNFNNNTLFSFREIPFPEAVLTKIKTDKKGTLRSELNGSLRIEDILVKANGDKMVLLEMTNTVIKTIVKTKQSGAIEEGVGVDLNSGDILYLNFSPKNELTFSGVVKKNQQRGLVEAASFVATTVDNTTHILFNSLEKKSSKILQYTISEDGSTVEELEIESNPNQYLTPKKLDTGFSAIRRNVMNIGPAYLLLKEQQAILVEAMDGQKSTLVKIKL